MKNTDFNEYIIAEDIKYSHTEAGVNYYIYIDMCLTMEEIYSLWKSGQDVFISEFCEEFECSYSDIIGRSRKGDLKFARHFYCIIRHIDSSLTDVGRELNNRDHATIINSIKKAKNMKSTKDPYYLAHKEYLNKFNIDW